MAAGSLFEQITALQTAFGALGAITGTSDGGVGLYGAANFSASLPGNFEIEASMTVQAEGLFAFDARVITMAQQAIALINDPQAIRPDAVLNALTEQLAGIGTLLDSNLIGQLTTLITTIRAIADDVPENPAGVFSTLLDQLLQILGTLDGEDAQKIRAWAQSVQKLHQQVLPLILEAQANPDPTALALAFVERQVNSTLETLGYTPLRDMAIALTRLPQSTIPQSFIDGVTATAASLTLEYEGTITLTGAPLGDLSRKIYAVTDQFAAYKAALRALFNAVGRVAEAPILQPGALEAFIRKQMEQALSVNVQEVQQIDSPFQTLLDRIDEAIAGIDLQFVREDVLGFFERTRDTLNQVDIPSLNNTLVEQLAPLETAVTEIEQRIAGLVNDVDASIGQYLDAARAQLAPIGAFQPDGTFTFHFEGSLREVLTQARQAIGGDSSSVASELTAFRETVNGLIADLDALLQPVDEGMDSAVQTVEEGIASFAEFVNGLDLPVLLETLAAEVAKVVDALTPIDFQTLVEPVIDELNANTEKLREIDPVQLGDILRDALKAALDVVISIDFSVEISKPLEEGYAVVRTAPQAAIDALQERYEQALSLLDALNPTQLLEALFEAFDHVKVAVGRLSVAGLLQPLDALHDQYIVQPLRTLKPSTLIAPLSAAYASTMTLPSDLNGAALLAPITAELDRVKQLVSGFSITGWLDDLRGIITTLRERLSALRPSEAIAPLVKGFAELEAALDQFKPSVLFAPVAELAAPLLSLLENAQQDFITALFNLFQEPLSVLEQLEPHALETSLSEKLNQVISLLRSANLPGLYNRMRGQYVDLRASIDTAQVDAEVRLQFLVSLDPQLQFGDMILAYNQLIASLERIRDGIAFPKLTDLYTELQARLLGMLPPYARELMDPEKFKRIMRLADPTRFLADLDARFDALKARLIPIRPADIAAELDATYDELVGLIAALELDDVLDSIEAQITRIKDVITGLRVDFLADDLDAALDDVQAILNALNPARIARDLDALYGDVENVALQIKPSVVLADLQAPMDRIQAMVNRLDPRATLGPPLEAAWQAIQNALDEIDLGVLVEPLNARLDKLQVDLLTALRAVEAAFDEMLRAAGNALGGGAISVSVSAEVTV